MVSTGDTYISLHIWAPNPKSLKSDNFSFSGRGVYYANSKPKFFKSYNFPVGGGGILPTQNQSLSIVTNCHFQEGGTKIPASLGIFISGGRGRWEMVFCRHEWIGYSVNFEHKLLSTRASYCIWRLINIFKKPWNFQHGFQHALKVSSEFSTHLEILNTFSTCLEILNPVFNMFWHFKHSFSTCFQHI